MCVDLCLCGVLPTCQAILAVCVESLAHQQSLLSLFLDALLRRAVISTYSVAQYVYHGPNATVMSAGHMGDNIWVWAVSEAAVDRSLDIVVAAVSADMPLVHIPPRI